MSSNSQYDHHLKAMEESLVKLRLSELARIRSRAKSKENMQPVNGTIQKDGKYYLVRLEMEREKIKSLIDAAERELMLSQLPDEASGIIRNAIGKGQLLITKRFKQFSELCQDNIDNDPDKKETKPTDLLGYWEMMFIQIEDISALFIEINKLKANNWQSMDTLDGPKAPSPKSLTPKNRRKSPGNKSPRSKNNNVNDEKVKREAKNRLAAARKQAKLRMQQEQKDSSLNNSQNGDSSFNLSLNGSNLLADVSLNSSLNSSLEILNTDTPESRSPTGTQSPTPESQSPTESQLPNPESQSPTETQSPNPESQSPTETESQSPTETQSPNPERQSPTETQSPNPESQSPSESQLEIPSIPVISVS